jgi:hypothetical protein
MKKRIGIILIIGLLLALCGCVAEVHPGGYYGYYGYYGYPSYRYYDYGYPYGGSFYYYRR